MKILSALNAFKGSPKDQNVVALNNVVAEVLGAKNEVEIFPIADGGDGTLDACLYHARNDGGQEQTHIVQNPLGETTVARWLHLPKYDSGNTAIIEMAQASGLALIDAQDRDPLVTSSYGTGQLVRQAIRDGAKNILLTVGGSATVDGGMGMLRALGAEFKDQSGRPLTDCGASLEKVASIDLTKVRELLGDTKLIFLCDVKTPFKAKKKDDPGVLLYAPQKFPNQEHPPNQAMEQLQRGVDNFARVVDAISEGKPSQRNSTGAAGGITFIPIAQFGAIVKSGFKYLAKMFSLEKKIKEADLVITGEGKLDDSTFEGKAPDEIIKLAKKHGKKVVFVCGGIQSKYNDKALQQEKGIDLVVKIRPAKEALEVSIPKTLENLKTALENKLGAIGKLQS